MKRSLPLWIVAVLPATMAGHALSYALSWHAMADGHHNWFVPFLETAIAVTLGISIWLFAGALTRPRRHTLDLACYRTSRIWPRMAALQTALFLAIERVEGTPAGLLGCAAQVAIALIAAYLVCALASLLRACEKSAEKALRYLERLTATTGSYFGREHTSAAISVPVCVRSSTFGRAPPHA